jgi:uncharacterized membrane protein
MLRELAKKHYVGLPTTFRYRGEEPSRIEALSDSCFALAIGLLLISTKSPDTFDELVNFTYDLFPFALCMLMIMWVWFQHFTFFIRYGLRNSVIVAFNTVLLLIILFYVYPLKFLARLLTQIYSSLFGQLFGIDGSVSSVTDADGRNMPELMMIYGTGVAGIFIVLMFMYRYALKNKEELGLNEIEIFETRTSIYGNLLMASIPLLSVLLSVVIRHPVIAGIIGGITYLLYWPVMSVFSRITTKKRKSFMKKATSIGFITSPDSAD